MSGTTAGRAADVTVGAGADVTVGAGADEASGTAAWATGTAAWATGSGGGKGARAAVRRLTVLYDARCSLCTFLRDWLVRQPQLVPLELVPAGSDEARRRHPDLDHAATFDEITVVGDAGQVYRGGAAWIVTLWALREHRGLAHRLSTPAGVRLAKGAALAAAKWRGAQSSGAWPGGAQWSATQSSRAQWGGRAYRRGDGWSYDPSRGWTYNAPGCESGSCATQ